MIVLRILVPFVILGGAAYWAYTKATNPKEAGRKRGGAPQELRVDAIRLEKGNYTVKVQTRGSVRPRTESTLISEVTGKVKSISPSFRDGKFFEEGEVLLQIDKLDYETAEIIAKGELARAKAVLQEEQSKAAQALETWKRLGREGEPSDLTLRKPQLAEAEAREKAAQAQLEKAERDLERTTIKAPYAGRVLRKEVDEGQVVREGANLARVFAVDFAEIRLPLTDRQAGFIDLPESYRGDEVEQPVAQPDVSVTGLVGGKTVTWDGKIVRVEGAIDQSSRQLFVVAQVEDPYGKNTEGKPPLRVNLFVEAEIEGTKLTDVIVIPRHVVRAGDEVIVINEKNEITRRKVEPVWQDAESLVVEVGVSKRPPEVPGDPFTLVGLEAGELVCVTPLPFAAAGVKVVPHIKGESPPPLATAEGRKGKGSGRKQSEGGEGKPAGGGQSVSGESKGTKRPVADANSKDGEAS